MTRSRGFTIAELAVALAIIALLLFGAMMPFSTQVEIRNVNETRRTMDSINEAIIGFAQANGRLPCPANGATPTGAGAGIEQFTSPSCTATFGVVPWATLGTPETDTWGRRFSYWVAPNFADAAPGSVAQPPPASLVDFGSTQPTPCTPTPQPTQSSFALCSLGIFTVNTRKDSDHSAGAIGTVLPAVFISHGKNGYGAYTINGTTLPTAGIGADETANANHTTGSLAFVSRPQSASASGCNDATSGSPFCEFDDLVVMISSNVLIARMVAAGKLP